MPEIRELRIAHGVCASRGEMLFAPQQAEVLRVEVRARNTKQVVQRASGLEGDK